LKHKLVGCRLLVWAAVNFDVKLNRGESVAMRIGRRYGECCVALRLAGKGILYANELKYLGIHVIAAKYLWFSVVFKGEILSYIQLYLFSIRGG